MNSKLAIPAMCVGLLGVVGGVAAANAFQPAEKPAPVVQIAPAAETVEPTVEPTVDVTTQVPAPVATTEATVKVVKPAPAPAPVESTTSEPAPAPVKEAPVAKPAPAPAPVETTPEPVQTTAPARKGPPPPVIGNMNENNTLPGTTKP